MSASVFDFLRLVGERPDLLGRLKVAGKDEVLGTAFDLGFSFTEHEFDTAVWGAEMRLAQRRGEAFDAHFGLWELMWGRYYLEYLVTDLVQSLEEVH